MKFYKEFKSLSGASKFFVFSYLFNWINWVLANSLLGKISYSIACVTCICFIFSEIKKRESLEAIKKCRDKNYQLALEAIVETENFIDLWMNEVEKRREEYYLSREHSQDPKYYREGL